MDWKDDLRSWHPWLDDADLRFGEGWYGLAHRLCTEIEAVTTDDQRRTMRVNVLKEKFGRLRVHGLDIPSAVQALIEQAEADSTVTCELCGRTGCITSRGGRIRTLCPDHARDFGAEPVDLADPRAPGTMAWRGAGRRDDQDGR